jgi:hypothetical protein
MNEQDSQEREIIDEINRLLDEATDEGEIVVRIVASDIVAKLRSNSPELLAAWLDLRAEEILAGHLAARLNSKRAYRRSMHNRSVFAEAVQAFEETGDPGSFELFNSLVVINAGGLRRRFGDLTADDCRFVAASYEKSRRESEMYEKFHRRLAEKLGDKTIREVYSESQCIAMLGSFRNAP